ncbi:MAG: hypothetical protein JSS89_12105 [Bacteroidetes bacterium]|nr:hypothetical protein [Bacteroidota bacterium]
MSRFIKLTRIIERKLPKDEILPHMTHEVEYRSAIVHVDPYSISLAQEVSQEEVRRTPYTVLTIGTSSSFSIHVKETIAEIEVLINEQRNDNVQKRLETALSTLREVFAGVADELPPAIRTALGFDEPESPHLN